MRKPEGDAKGDEGEEKGADAEVKGERLKAKGRKRLVQNDLPEAKVSPPEANALEHSATLISAEIDKSGPENRIADQQLPSEYFENTATNKKFEIEHSTFEIMHPLTTDHSSFITDHSPLTNMEVHHHPNVEKKGIKEYMLEGFMIFIAVMMGFFAESYREHLSDQTKEREYAANIKKDFETNLANLAIWIPSLYQRVAQFDTLIAYLETPGVVKNGSNMYYLARLSTRNVVFEPNDNTILEMKSSGNLRLIRNRETINGLMDFERATAQYTNLVDIEGKEDVLSYPLLGELFDATVFDKMVIVRNTGLTETDYAIGSVSNTIKPPGNPQMLSHDKVKINQLIYYFHQRKSSFLGEVRHLTVQKQLTQKLIDMINKDYKLTNE
jgi:hypothetical protein